MFGGGGGGVNRPLEIRGQLFKAGLALTLG